MSPRADLIVDSKDAAKQLKKMVGDKTPMLILYHAHWCPHCVHFVGPHHEDSYPWQQICKKINGKVTCVEVESENMGHLDPEYSQVQGFPTLMYMRGGYKAEFAGNRNDVKALDAFVVGQNARTASMGGAQPAKPAGAKPVKPAKPAKPAKQLAGCGCGGRVGGRAGASNKK